jgi:hypothetical protein
MTDWVSTACCLYGARFKSGERRARLWWDSGLRASRFARCYLALSAPTTPHHPHPHPPGFTLHGTRNTEQVREARGQRRPPTSPITTRAKAHPQPKNKNEPTADGRRHCLLPEAAAGSGSGGAVEVERERGLPIAALFFWCIPVYSLQGPLAVGLGVVRSVARGRWFPTSNVVPCPLPALCPPPVSPFARAAPSIAPSEEIQLVFRPISIANARPLDWSGITHRSGPKLASQNARLLPLLLAP